MATAGSFSEHEFIYMNVNGRLFLVCGMTSLKAKMCRKIYMAISSMTVNLYCVIAAIGSIIIKEIYMKEKLKIYSHYEIAMGIPYDWRYKIGRSNNG